MSQGVLDAKTPKATVAAARDDYDNAFVKKFAAMMSSLTEKEWELVEAKARFLFDLKKGAVK